MTLRALGDDDVVAARPTRAGAAAELEQPERRLGGGRRRRVELHAELGGAGGRCDDERRGEREPAQPGHPG